MNRFLSCFTILTIASALTSNIAVASPGHDHAHDDPPAAGLGPASPRFEARSDLFEVVGIMEGNELSLFVDRFADNAPVLKAKVELESGATQAIGKFHEEHGDYSFAAAPFQKPGSYPITLTVTAGEEIDVLAGNLVVPDEDAGYEHEESTFFKRAGLWSLGLSGLIAFILIARQLIKRRNAGALK